MGYQNPAGVTTGGQIAVKAGAKHRRYRLPLGDARGMPYAAPADPGKFALLHFIRTWQEALCPQAFMRFALVICSITGISCELLMKRPNFAHTC